jgi:Vacuolar protein sorting-associated protein 62
VLAVALGLPVEGRAGRAETELAQRYAPVVRLVRQDEPCHHGEPYRPTDVNLVLGNPDVALRGPWDRTNIIKVAPTAADLAGGLFGYHLDFPGHAVTPGCVYDEWSHRLNKSHPARAYARVVAEPAFPTQIALQYWFFYVFNNFNDKHEGDWEMIQLDFDASSAQQALGMRPALVGFSQHEGAESAHWDDSKLEIVDGTHPVVYPALGSHANYYTPALHLGRSAAQGVGCDDTSGRSLELRPVVSVVPTRKAAYLRAFPWLGFEGHWGEERESFYNGPTGPVTKPQWTEPITWANDAWRDESFTVPAGNTFGATATGFFCGAVAAGSTLLTSLVGSPSPVLIVLAVILGIVLWLTSQTRWQPSAPLRLARRRSWGSIVTAARRMYFGHLRLFLEIGLLFFPLGALISGLQYLLFRAGGLNGLVAAAGSTNAVVDFLAVALGLVITVFGLAVIQSVTAIAMVEIDAGRDVKAWSAYRKAVPKLGSLLGTVLLVAVALTLVSFTAIGVLLAVWLIVRWAFMAQVLVLEDTSRATALHGSAQLVRGNWWRVASLILFITVIALLLGPLFGTVLLLISSASFDFINLVSSVIYAIVIPYAAIATTYLYFDRRIAKQHQTAAEEHGDVLPEETPPPALAPR